MVRIVVENRLNAHYNCLIIKLKKLIGGIDEKTVVAGENSVSDLSKKFL